MMNALKLTWLAGAASLAIAGVAQADALSTPAMTAPLAANATPYAFDAGEFGKIYITGQLTGLATWQTNAVPGNTGAAKVDISNAQIEIQKSDGVFQFYVQGGTYNFPSLGSAYVRTKDLPEETFHYVPVAFIKIAPNAAFSIQAGELPTLIGAEYTFTFQNMNIARGLLWNQEPAISRGVQVNYTQGAWTIAASVNDGYFSNHYSTGSALITYVASPKDTFAFAGSANFSKTSRSTFVTPVAQNNGEIFNLFWTHTDGALMIEPYLQYSHTKKEVSLGLPGSASTYGAAVLAKYSFTPMFSLAGRAEYEDSSGKSVSLLYGPKSSAWSVTLTPTFQIKQYFVRGEVSYTRLGSIAVGSGFGSLGDKKSQTRARVETGVLF